MRSECSSRPDCETRAAGGTEGRRPQHGWAFREGVGEQTGTALGTWPARAGRHDPAVWTQPKKMLVGGAWLWSGDAELEVPGGICIPEACTGI